MKVRFKEFFYISNQLSLLRIVLAVPIWILLKEDSVVGNQWLMALTIIGVATDYFDGYFSRKLNQVTDLGKLLDPLADKIAMAIILIGLIIYRDFPIELTVLLLYRDLLIMVVGFIALRRSGTPVMANFLGKLNTSIIALAAVLYIFNIKNVFFDVVLYCSYAILLVSGISYLKIGEALLFTGRKERLAFRTGIMLLTIVVIYFTLKLQQPG